ILQKHERAFEVLLPKLGNVRTVSIVGGGIFPRTALILERLLPGAKLTVLDASEESLRAARPFLNGEVELVRHFFEVSALGACLKNSGAGLRPAMNERLARENTGARRPKGRRDACPTTFSKHVLRNADLIVIPLAFIGNRSVIYRDPPAPAVLVHDWIWRRRGTGVVISLALLKRLNLVKQ